MVVDGLGSVVLAPDVQHEHAGNEEEGHHQHRHRPHLDSRRVVCVESPHAAAAGPAGPAASTAGGCGCAGSFPLASPPCPSSARPR